MDNGFIFKKLNKNKAKLRQPTGQRQENFNFTFSLLKFYYLGSSNTPETVDFTPP